MMFPFLFQICMQFVKARHETDMFVHTHWWSGSPRCKEGMFAQLFFLLQFSFSLYAALIYMVILFMMGFDFIFDNWAGCKGESPVTNRQWVTNGQTWERSRCSICSSYWWKSSGICFGGRHEAHVLEPGNRVCFCHMLPCVSKAESTGSFTCCQRNICVCYRKQCWVCSPSLCRWLDLSKKV